MAHQRPPQQALDRYAEEFNASLAMKTFGVRIHFPPNEEKVVAIIDPLGPQHRGGLGTDAVNGGVLAAMFDLVTGCTPALIDPTRRNATMQLSISFMQGLFGSVLRAEAWIDRAGASTIFSAARILDEKGNVCAKCDGMVKVSNLKWKTGGSPAVT